MPFFGFLGGIVLASLVLLVVADRRRTDPKQRLDLTTLPRPAFLLLAAYVALFAIMWMYFFDGVLGRVREDYPAAPYSLVFRSYFAQMERWDFIVTLLAFIVGGLLVLARDSAAGSGSKLSLIAAAGTPAPPAPPTSTPARADPPSKSDPPSKPDPSSEDDGIVAASLRQLKRITALNLLLVFALILVTMPALLPWIERRLDVVKLGSFEARFAPLAENTRRTSMPDTPSLATNRDLSNYLTLSGPIKRVTRVLERAPGVAGDTDVRIEEFNRRYQATDRFFSEEIIPSIGRMFCLSELSGIRIPDMPGVREASSAFLATLDEVRDSGTTSNLQHALAGLSRFNAYYDQNYDHMDKVCSDNLNGLYEEARFNSEMQYGWKSVESSYSLDPTPKCGVAGGEEECKRIFKNGYAIRFVLELAKLSSPEQDSGFLFDIYKNGYLDDQKYKEFGITDIDRFNLQLLKTKCIADLHVNPSRILGEYLKEREISDGFLGAMRSACGSCSGKGPPLAGLSDDYQVYHRVANWFVDADAVITVGTAMLRRIPLNQWNETEKAAVKKLLQSAIASRNEIGIVDEFSSETDRWAAAMLEEGIATIRYVQLVEAPETLASQTRVVCGMASGRLRGAVQLYDKLKQENPEHRINQMRAERTLVLVEQHCR